MGRTAGGYVVGAAVGRRAVGHVERAALGRQLAGSSLGQIEGEQ